MLDEKISVSDQIKPEDIQAIAQAGFKSIICNRPDGEGVDQPVFSEIEASANKSGLIAVYQPILSGKINDNDVTEFGKLIQSLPKPIFSFCRTGTRSITLWALSECNQGRSLPDILAKTKAAGYDMSAVTRRIVNGGKTPTDTVEASHTVIIIGGGAAGIAVASSLKARKPDLDIALIDPADIHYYQPGWTMVGGGIFNPAKTAKTMASLIPEGVRWIKAAVAAFEPEKNTVILEGRCVLKYQALVVVPGLKLNWSGIEGLTETLGRNGVTSNYRYDLAPYTWELVQNLKKGRAVFTQPPMPIKCAGAPQKALYLSADHWLRNHHLNNIQIDFFNATPVLFGVKDYVPPLMEYIKRYNVNLHLQHRLSKIDGPSRKAWFIKTNPDGTESSIETGFEMIHVVPPQLAPDFIRVSQLADSSGWVDVDQNTLRHKTFDRIYSLGDVCNAPNAKTAAAARKQAPIVAHNLLKDLGAIKGGYALYDGYGSCPLTVERGKIILAEFGYGGKLLPTFPSWLIEGTKPSQLAWLLKEKLLPPLYWKAMLKGKELLARPLISL